MAFFRQTFVLAGKDLKIVGRRRWLTTLLRALALPIVYIVFIAYVRNFFLPPSRYGIGTPRPILDLTTEVFNSSIHLKGRDRVVFINNGFTGGEIEILIELLSIPLRDVGADVRILASDDELLDVCPSSLSGLSPCYASASFHSSPTEGNTGIWSYTTRIDGGLGFSVFVDRPDNDAQVFVLPFVQAIDRQIALLSGTSLSSEMLEYPFTYDTAQDHADSVQQYFMRALENYLAVTLFIAVCGITFHLPGYIAVERQVGLSSLIDVMSRCRTGWLSATSRLVAAYGAFVTLYFPGWLVIGIIVSRMIFSATSPAIIIPVHLLLGLSLTGYSAFAASFFRRAQLSGITVLLISLAMGIVVQFVPRSAISISVLAALFPSATYTAFAIQTAQWERQLVGAQLTGSPPDINVPLPGYVYFAFLGGQALVYPILAIIAQRTIHGVSKHHHRATNSKDHSVALRVVSASKTFGKNIRAVDNLSMSIIRGQLVCLLGVNGSGKSTLIAGITGAQSLSSGCVELTRSDSIGLCPQANVAWDDLTVYENVGVFRRLKAGFHAKLNENSSSLISACDLTEKQDGKPRTLSGGQRRKLQLAMAFAGGSTICFVDEASSGLDPLSRRKIWDILLAERGRRTIVLTTHALDEADVLADHIVVMSAGRLLAEGSAAELKHRYGGGYRVTTSQNPHRPDQLGRDRDDTVITVADSADICEAVNGLERHATNEVSVSSPTMEDVFLALSSQSGYGAGEENHHNAAATRTAWSVRNEIWEMPAHARDRAGATTEPGKGTSFLQQARILFAKRLLVSRRNFVPYIFAIAIPVLTTALGASFFLQGFNGIPCSRGSSTNTPDVITLPVLDRFWGIDIPFGPPNRFYIPALPSGYGSYRNWLHPVYSLSDFKAYIRKHFRDVVPGGMYLEGHTPWLAYRLNGSPGYAALAKGLADSYLMGRRIDADFSTFALPITGATGDSLQLILYLGMALSAFPAFFALYPTFERLSNVRALHYSSGVRPAALWLSYWLFDGIIVTVVAITVTVLIATLSSAFYAPGYLFFAFFLFGLCSTLLAYVISIFSKTQLSAFAFCAGFQAVSLLIYFVMYMVLLTFGSAEQFKANLNAVQATYGLISPSGCLLRVLLLSLNQSQLLCRDQAIVSYPGAITVYGGPYLYFILQCAGLYTLLVAYDSGWRPQLPMLRRSARAIKDFEKEYAGLASDVRTEEIRAEESCDELRLLHLRKDFRNETVVDNATLGVDRGSILSLLGPNGAGKTTTLGLVRGDLRASSSDSEVLVSGRSVRTDKLAARRHLGVCPQFNALDRMTVKEHLSLYARLRGVLNVARSVTAVVESVGIAQYSDQFTAQLSGGNQRKLSLATAIIGNPSVVLLDEPSSGMDALAMRTMWQAIRDVSAERAVLITTHSMEEATALSDKVAIMDKRILSVGSPVELRNRHGKGLYQVHIALRRGSTATNDSIRAVCNWIVNSCSASRALRGPMSVMHGQARFQIALQQTRIPRKPVGHVDSPENMRRESYVAPRSNNSLSSLLKALEESKKRFGVEYYSISPMTLEDVFLEIVGSNRRK